MIKNIFCLVTVLFFVSQVLAQETVLQYLSGTDKDHTITWDFMCTKG